MDHKKEQTAQVAVAPSRNSPGPAGRNGDQPETLPLNQNPGRRRSGSRLAVPPALGRGRGKSSLSTAVEAWKMLTDEDLADTNIHSEVQEGNATMSESADEF